jgi:hypothetical protein
MKKLVLTAAILMGFVMGSYAQHSLFEGKGNQTKGGLFYRGDFSENYTKGEDINLWLPTHNINGNGDATNEPEAPLGGGALLLIGFGAAYAMSKRNKKD